MKQNYLNIIMIYLIILIMILMKESEGHWKLHWNDEFENQTMDSEKWDIINDVIPCNGNGVHQLNCNTNSSRNLKLIDGTLAIAAIYEKHLDKDYTSGKIITKEGFTYGRFEIRAALPNGKMLRPSMIMTPVKSAEWAKNGQIDIMTNNQTKQLGSGLHYGVWPHINYNNGERDDDYTTNKNLNDFHIYTLEWNASKIIWFIDDISYITIDINRKLSPIYAKNSTPFDMSFRLQINLGIGGHAGHFQFFPNQVLTIDDVIGWECSLFILDYVRIYKWVNETENLNLTESKVSADKICSDVMPLISPKRKPKSISLTTLISSISSFIFIFLISIVIFLLIRQKRLKNMLIKSNLGIYDDTRIDADHDNEAYDDVFNESNDYVEPYEDNHQRTGTEERSGGISHVRNPLNEDMNNKPTYLALTQEE